MTTHEQRAKELFLSGYNCAQAVFAAFAPELGLTEKTALRLASSFGGGIAGMRETCGAVSGMLMAAGVLYGYDSADAGEEKKNHYARCRALAEEFAEKNGSTVCRDLLGLQAAAAPPATERTQQYYAERPCARLVASAAAILDEYILKNPPRA